MTVTRCSPRPGVSGKRHTSEHTKNFISSLARAGEGPPEYADKVDGAHQPGKGLSSSVSFVADGTLVSVHPSFGVPVPRRPQESGKRRVPGRSDEEEGREGLRDEGRFTFDSLGVSVPSSGTLPPSPPQRPNPPFPHLYLFVSLLKITSPKMATLPFR